MKKRNNFAILAGMFLLVAAAGISSCTTNDFSEDAGALGLEGEDSYSASGKSTNGGSGDEQSGNTQAGIVTAGEWSDLGNWAFWSKLMLGTDFSETSNYWQFYTNKRVSVKVTDSKGNALAGLSIKLLRKNYGGETTLWEAVTDNHGQADCWVGLNQKETANVDNLRISINEQLMEGNPCLTPWDSIAQTTVNEYVYQEASTVAPQADIAFIVDATGSMGDEIDFLKSDLEDIISKAAAVRPSQKIRTAALFYRDEGDDYLTRHSDFTEKLGTTKDFVSQQNANGGGDYPEAVHTALKQMLQSLSWDSQARTRLAFLILDAPAHHEDEIIHSLQQSIALCARQGIRLIPVAASGVDKNTEFMLRFFSIATGGTYVFITNHSGVGFDHIAASVGDYKVEQLNNLIIRLIEYYTE